MKNKIFAYFTNILLLLFSLCIAVIIAEIALPFLNIPTIEEAVYQSRRPVVQGIYGEYHPELSYTLQKNLRNIRQYYPDELNYTVNSNKYGFRGPAWDLSPGRKNILILGDSFAFGWGVQWEETAGQIVEKELQKIDASFQTINLAIPGWDLDKIIRSFEVYHNLLNPVAVIYIFCPNDLLCVINKIAPDKYDIEHHHHPGNEKNFEAMVARQQSDYWSWNKFYRQSYGKAYHARVIRPIFSKRIYNSLRIDPAPEGYDFTPPINPPAKSTLERKYKDFFIYCMNRLHSTLKEGELYIIDTSDKSILYKNDRPDNRRWLVRNYSLQNPKTHFIDFESIVRNTPGSRRYFLHYDDHWSAEGHSAAAKLLLKKIKSTLPNLKGKVS